MAMTKAERAEMERLASDLRKAKALRWLSERAVHLDTDAALFRIPPSARAVTAWSFNAHTGDVREGCFSSASHSYWRTDKVESQGRGGPWFPTKRDALLALRHAATEECAKRLAAIDARIDLEPSA